MAELDTSHEDAIKPTDIETTEPASSAVAEVAVSDLFTLPDAFTAPPPPPPKADDSTIELVGHVAEVAPRWSYNRTAAPAHFLTVPSLGPVGRRRHPLAVLILTILTLGGYLVAWHSRVNREVSEFDARINIRPGRSVFAVLLPWATCFAASAAGAVLLGLFLTHHPLTVGIDVIVALCAGIGVVGPLTVLFPPALVASAMTVERVRLVEERVGMGSEDQIRPAGRVAWLAVPVIGVIVYIVSVQRRLNAVWSTVEPRISKPAR